MTLPSPLHLLTADSGLTVTELLLPFLEENLDAQRLDVGHDALAELAGGG